MDEAERIEKNKEFYQYFESLVEAYDREETRFDFSAMLKEQPAHLEGTDLTLYITQFLLYLCFMPTLKRLYREHHYSDEMYEGVFKDLYCKMIECHDVKKVWGSFVCAWFNLHLSLKLFPIGRLQYQPGDTVDKRVPSPLGGKPAIHIHIPSSGPLIKEEIEDSLKRATAFFADSFEGDSVLFTTTTWLLAPYHREMLKESSGIITFMNCFDEIWPIDNNGEDTLWRVFSTDQFDDLLALPADTTLRRGYLKLLKEHTPFQAGIGIITMKKP